MPSLAPYSSSTHEFDEESHQTRVDGEDVYRQPIEKVIQYILGEPDSKITMTFQRFSGDKITKFTADLKRGQTAKIAKAVVEDEDEDGEADGQAPPPQANAVVAAEASAMKAEALEEKQLAQQQRVSERLARMKEMQEIIAMSYTGSSHIEDAAGEQRAAFICPSHLPHSCALAICRIHLP